jgi:hypothetical protein
MTSSNLNLSEFSEDDFYDFSKDTLLIGKLFRKSIKNSRRLSKKKSL